MSIYPNIPGTSELGAGDAGSLAYRNTAAGPTDSVAGSDAKLWLPIWSGEVLHAYDEYNMFEPRVTSKSIASGREMEFPITGTVSLKAEWAAGEYLYGTQGTDGTAGNFSISLDNRPMAAHFELDNVDLMITQWEYRQELARQAGLTLANARDKQIARYIAGAAGVELTSADPRTALGLPAPFDTSVAIGAGTENSPEEALAVLEAIEEFNVECQENDVPVGQAFCAVTPKLFQAIRRLGVAESTSTGIVGSVNNMQPMFGGVAAAGGLGAQLQQGLASLQDSLTYMGCTIIKSNHIPVADDVAGTVGQAKYEVYGGFAGIRALIWMPDCVAALRKTGLVVDTEDDKRRNSTFTVASMMSGTGILKPELAKVVVNNSSVVNRAAYIDRLTSSDGAATDGTGAQFGYATA